MTTRPAIEGCRALRRSVLFAVAVLCLNCGGGGRDAEHGGDTAPSRAGTGAAVEAQRPESATAPPLDANPDGLQVTIDSRRQAVEGRFRSLRFEARLTGQGQAVATFERVAGMTLVSTIRGPNDGGLEWRGTNLDGFGPATSEEREAMGHYADRLKADELARIPLDLACRAGADDLDPAVGAALVLPWQILLKYQPEGDIPTPPEAAAQSQCQYLLSPLQAVDLERVPSPSVAALSTEQPIPMAIGYLPLDRQGIPQPAYPRDDSDG